MSAEKESKLQSSIDTDRVADVYGSRNNCGFNCVGQGIIDHLCYDQDGNYDPTALKQIYDKEPLNGPIHALMHSFAKKFGLEGGELSWATFEKLFLDPKAFSTEAERQCLWGDVLRFHLKQIQTNSDEPYKQYHQQWKDFVGNLEAFCTSEKEVQQVRKEYENMSNPGATTGPEFLQFYCEKVLNVQFGVYAAAGITYRLTRADLSRDPRPDVKWDKPYLVDNNRTKPAYFSLNVVNVGGNHWVFETRSKAMAKKNTDYMHYSKYVPRRFGLSEEQRYGDKVRAAVQHSNPFEDPELASAAGRNFWAEVNKKGELYTTIRDNVVEQLKELEKHANPADKARISTALGLMNDQYLRRDGADEVTAIKRVKDTLIHLKADLVTNQSSNKEQASGVIGKLIQMIEKILQAACEAILGPRVSTYSTALMLKETDKMMKEQVYQPIWQAHHASTRELLSALGGQGSKAEIKAAAEEARQEIQGQEVQIKPTPAAKQPIAEKSSNQPEISPGVGGLTPSG